MLHVIGFISMSLHHNKHAQVIQTEAPFYLLKYYIWSLAVVQFVKGTFQTTVQI